MKLIALTLVLTILFLFAVLTFSHVDGEIKVGVYYYPWYTGNWEIYHANCIDTPVLGYYNSQDVTVIRKHLEWLEDLGVDFLIVSWWGPGSFTDNATKILFQEAANSKYQPELAIFVEPFDPYGNGTYDFTAIYNHVYDTYVSRYPNLYMKLYGYPLICFYNDAAMTPDGKIPLDDRFEVRIIGHQPYVHWLYSRNYGMRSWSNELARMDGQISVMPRYDDTHFRDPGQKHDPTYSEGYYDQQWNNAINLARQGKVKIVTIATWNEFAERTQIEPCIDQTSYKRNEPYYIYHKTKQYIARIKSPIPRLPTEIVAVLGALALALALATALKLLTKR